MLSRYVIIDDSEPWVVGRKGAGQRVEKLLEKLLEKLRSSGDWSNRWIRF
jgi:hypothetical protein